MCWSTIRQLSERSVHVSYGWCQLMQSYLQCSRDDGQTEKGDHAWYWRDPQICVYLESDIHVRACTSELLFLPSRGVQPDMAVCVCVLRELRIKCCRRLCCGWGSLYDCLSLCSVSAFLWVICSALLLVETVKGESNNSFPHQRTRALVWVPTAVQSDPGLEEVGAVFALRLT